mgnify:FL=1|tara:strand:+ start:272 stop:748 length:477 start_codon:yes stop_codon:yes gene_type:complete
MIAYLSGAMEFADDEGASWRNEITIWLKDTINHQSIDPVIESAKIVKENNAENYRSWKVADANKYARFIQLCIKNDLEIVREKADYLICLWDENVIKGAGTHAEITFAYDLKKPVYLINKLSPKDLSGWIMACSSEIFSNFDDLKDFLIKKYKLNDRT